MSQKRPQRIKKPGWKWSIECPHTDSIEDLQGDLQKRVPKLILNMSPEKSVPFPSDSFGGISECEADFVMRVFQKTENSDYTYLTRLYYHLNLYFIQQEDGLEKACRLLLRTKEIIPAEVPIAPMVLILARAYLSEMKDRIVSIEKSLQVRDRTEWLDNEVMKPVHKLKKTFENSKRDMFQDSDLADKTKELVEELFQLLKQAQQQNEWEGKLRNGLRTARLVSNPFLPPSSNG